uniref:SOSEKI DIX-like domain-containing protein n=1 Tax=Davidia involucrata TaxID=16924 RepID=A0A5B7AWE6_DAVIN
MEGQGQGGGGDGGGGEVRRLHIIYFLSRNGRIEHPHLIRVHHLSRNGVRLRDVKRWLSELRGKDMPESFAWSYKRRYKTGFVWQDLLDEDLITPISDNEYVLKGSEIVSSTFGNDLHSYGEKKASMQKDPPLEIDPKDHKHKLSSKEEIEQHPETLMDVLRKPLSEIEEESPPFSSETSTLSDEEENHSDTNKQEIHQESDKFENSYSSIYSNLITKRKSNNNNKEKATTPASSSSSSSWSHSPFTKSKSYSSTGPSHMFRNLIKCGAVDTNEAAMIMINRRNKNSLNVSTNNMKKETAEICKGDKLGGSERNFGISWNQHNHTARMSCDGPKGSKKNRKSEFSDQKPVSAAYKPVNGPNCSQCGKMFKPEKMHTHMKSCKGMKSMAKGAVPAPTTEKTQSQSSMDFFGGNQSGFCLTN